MARAAKSSPKRAAGASKAKSTLAKAGLAPGRTASIVLGLAAAIGIGIAIWSQIPTQGAIAAKESEWKIVISANAHTAGDVTFHLDNRGTVPHEFLVVATDMSGTQLLDTVDPATNRLDEETLDVVDEQPEYEPGTTATLTVKLPKGHYVVMCNIEGHYKNGMFADLIISDSPDGSVVERTPVPEPVADIGPVAGTEKEWAIEISSSLHEAGTTTFNLQNLGTIAHEFLVVRSDKSATELLASVDAGTNRIDEEQLNVIDEQPEYDPGVPGMVTVNLEVGHYVVMCNIAGHYNAGMYADLEVVAAKPASGAVNGTEKEWDISLDAYSHTAGSITFDLTNAGTIAHEFLIVRSDLTSTALLANVDATTKRIDEALLDVIDEQPEYEPGVPGTVTVTLTPGHYVVMCNIEGHYKAGMYADFDVLAP
jgi:uncharacterized cupredoxin-like copper-binding protein